MGMLTDYYYTVLNDGTILSISRKSTLDANLLSMSGGESVYELKIDGTVIDFHKGNL